MQGEKKRQCRELMVDIETLSTDVNGAIAQIGAVYFSMKTGELGDEYLINIDLDDAIKHGATVDGRTLYWWMAQSEDARKGLTDPKPLKELIALKEFNRFWSRATRVWSHATFDFVILMNAMRRRNIVPQVHYRKARDIRTLTGLAGMTREEVETTKVERAGTHHNGLDDSLYQVQYCTVAYNKLMKSGYQDGYNDAERTYGNNN